MHRFYLIFLYFTFSVYLIYFHISRHEDITTKVRRVSNLPQTSVSNIRFTYFCIEYKEIILLQCAARLLYYPKTKHFLYYSNSFVATVYALIVLVEKLSCFSMKFCRFS